MAAPNRKLLGNSVTREQRLLHHRVRHIGRRCSDEPPRDDAALPDGLPLRDHRDRASLRRAGLRLHGVKHDSTLLQDVLAKIR